VSWSYLTNAFLVAGDWRLSGRGRLLAVGWSRRFWGFRPLTVKRGENIVVNVSIIIHRF
jgi:hypothetical protein